MRRQIQTLACVIVTALLQSPDYVTIAVVVHCPYLKVKVLGLDKIPGRYYHSWYEEWRVRVALALDIPILLVGSAIGETFLSNDILVIQRSLVDATRARLHNHMVSRVHVFFRNSKFLNTLPYSLSTFPISSMTNLYVFIFIFNTTSVQGESRPSCYGAGLRTRSVI